MSDDRLESWKDIASYFRRNIRTVQRWEKFEGLPVHRHAHRKRSSPFAYRSELEEWWASRGLELGAAEDAALPDSAPESGTEHPAPTFPPVPVRTRWRQFLANPMRVAAGTGAIVLLAALTFGAGPEQPWTLLAASPPPPVHWILVAEFDGPDEEPNLATIVRELAISALAQSRIVTPISTLELRSGLQAAMLPDTTRVAGEVARQLAYRASARTYIEGRVERVADGYFVLLRMLDAETGALRFSISDLARDRDQLIPTLDRLGRRLRQSLGENQDVVRATRPYYHVITPSFEAFCLYQASLDANIRDNDKVRALRLAQEALAIDPDFALAWWHLAMMALDAGGRDSRARATHAFEHARRRPDRMTPVQRLLAECDYQEEIRGNMDAAYRAASEAVRQASNVEAASALHSLGMILGYMGRGEEEAECLTRAASLSPFGLHEVVLYHLASANLNRGRVAQSIQISKKLTGVRRALVELWVAQASLDWPRAESLGRERARDPLIGPAFRLQTLVGVAGAQAAQGELRAAIEQLQAVEQDTTSWYWPWFASFTRSFIAMRLLGSTEPQPAVELPADSTTLKWIEAGLLAAVRADTLSARRALQVLEARLTGQRAGEHRVDLDLLEAWIAFDAGRWGEVLRLLEPIATDGRYLWPGRVPARWLVAEAYEQLDDASNAIAYYEMALTSKGTDTSDRNGLLGFVSPFAHARLVALYAGAGREDDAERHGRALLSACTREDCDLQALVDQARAAMSSARPGA